MSSPQRLNEAATASAGSENKPSPLRLLCVEDDRSSFLLLRQYLMRAPFECAVEITHFGTLAEAMACLRTAEDGPAFDIALLDLNLPDSTESETFDRVHEGAPDMPIIVLTGNDDQEMAVAMVQRGAQDYVPKDNLTSDLLFRAILYARERNRLRCDLTKLNAQLLKTTEDLRTTQMQLIQAEKLDSLGRIAAGVAHEIKNPLGIVLMGVAFFGSKRAELGETACGVLDSMQEAIDRAARIVHEMLAFSRSENLQLVTCAVNQLIQNALSMVHVELTKRKITLVRDLPLDLPNIRADPAKLSQVIVNLIMNAMQAMPDGGSIEVRTSLAKMHSIHRDEGARDAGRLRTGDPVVVIEVRDHGPGIPEQSISRIFEPFYTTKRTGEGTGLGLSVSKQIVELHRGHLEVANMNNPRGLRARILLKTFSESEKLDAARSDDPLAAAGSPG